MNLKLAVVALVFSWALSSCDSQTSAAKPLPQMLPGVRNFLESHSEFGEPIGTQAITDWAQGKRQRVQFSSGRNLLFYLNDGVVTTVWEDSTEKGRTKIWGTYALPPKDPLKNQDRSKTDSLPSYTIIRSMKMASGGRQADILIPEFSRDTPEELRSKTAFRILQAENLVSLSLYSTQEALKANISSSFAEKNPDAKEGILGGIYNGKWVYFE